MSALPDELLGIVCSYLDFLDCIRIYSIIGKKLKFKNSNKPMRYWNIEFLENGTVHEYTYPKCPPEITEFDGHFEARGTITAEHNWLLSKIESIDVMYARIGDGIDTSNIRHFGGEAKHIHLFPNAVSLDIYRELDKLPPLINKLAINTNCNSTFLDVEELILKLERFENIKVHDSVKKLTISYYGHGNERKVMEIDISGWFSEYSQLETLTFNIPIYGYSFTFTAPPKNFTTLQLFGSIMFRMEFVNTLYLSGEIQDLLQTIKCRALVLTCLNDEKKIELQKHITELYTKSDIFTRKSIKKSGLRILAVQNPDVRQRTGRHFCEVFPEIYRKSVPRTLAWLQDFNHQKMIFPYQ